MVDAPSSRRAKVVDRICYLQQARGRATVKASIVADGLSLTPKEVAPVLSDLADEGYLTEWGSSTPTTYIIDFDTSDPPGAGTTT